MTTLIDMESASRVFSQYEGSEVSLRIDNTTFDVILLEVGHDDLTLNLKFSWLADDIAHEYMSLRGMVGKKVKLSIKEGTLECRLTGTTEYPSGSDLSLYTNSPFMISVALPMRMQASGKGTILGIRIPDSVCQHLPLADDLEYAPHITLAYFPDLAEEDISKVVSISKDVCKSFGSLDIKLTDTTTFPTNNGGEYPHVGNVECPALYDLHNALVSRLEEYVEPEFAGKNYHPHVTLRYTEDPKFSSHTGRNIFSAPSMYLSFNGGDVNIDIPFTKSEEAFKPVDPISKLEHIRNAAADRGLYDIVARLTRILQPSIPGDIAIRLRKVSDQAKERGLDTISETLDRVLDENDDGEDIEALGPIFLGTDHHIVTYTKSPQTQVSVESPETPKSLPLHERI